MALYRLFYLSHIDSSDVESEPSESRVMRFKLFLVCLFGSMIINKKDRNLKKGSGYHLDLFLIGLLSIFCGFLGVPMMCSAPVRSVTHVSALSVYSTTHAPGEKPKLINVLEQRATALAVHVMIGK